MTERSDDEWSAMKRAWAEASQRNAAPAPLPEPVSNEPVQQIFQYVRAALERIENGDTYEAERLLRSVLITWENPA